MLIKRMVSLSASDLVVGSMASDLLAFSGGPVLFVALAGVSAATCGEEVGGVVGVGFAPSLRIPL